MLFKNSYSTLIFALFILHTVQSIPIYYIPAFGLNGGWASSGNSEASQDYQESSITEPAASRTSGIDYSHAPTPASIPSKAPEPSWFIQPSSATKHKRYDQPYQIFLYCFCGLILWGLLFFIFTILKKIALPERAIIIMEGEAKGYSKLKIVKNILLCWQFDLMLLFGLLASPMVLIYFFFKFCYIIDRFVTRKNDMRQTRKKIKLDNSSKPKDEDSVPKIVHRSEIDQYVPRYHSEMEMETEFLMPKDKYCQKLTYEAMRKGEKKQEEACIICLEHYFDKDKIIILPCEHYFHQKCLLESRKSQVRQMRRSSETLTFRCPLCQLNLLRHYLYYVENDLDPKEVKYCNRD